MITASKAARTTAPGRAWSDACVAAALVALDPIGLGGVRVRSAAGPVRDAWNRLWRSLLAPAAPVRAIPLSVDDGRLFGGLDLAASLRSGRPIHLPGILAEADLGYAVVAMAERVEAGVAARIGAAIECTRVAVIAFDEGDGDEALAETLAERLGLCIDLHDVAPHAIADASTGHSAESIANAGIRLPEVTIDDDLVAALCSAALVLGIPSMRAPMFAVRAARASAALDGRSAVDADDAAIAARLVYASRARQLPPAEADEPAPPERRNADDREETTEADDEPSSQGDRPPEIDEGDPTESQDRALDDVVLDAAVAAIPAALLDSLAAGATRLRSSSSRGGGAGARGLGRRRGAPAGVRRGRPRAPERLSLIETLRAAAPWQRIRRAEAKEKALDGSRSRVHVRVEDLHVVRFQQRHPTTTIFVVDASGSSALNRLAEAKGAVELLLADCYVRRDSVAVLAFRGKGAELLLPPTRSLVRARRSLARLPGGGGTPLAAALDATRELVVALRRRGDTALVIVLTDGRANVARDGSAEGLRPRPMRRRPRVRCARSTSMPC